MYAIISRLKELFEKLADDPELVAKRNFGVSSLRVELEEAALMVKEMRLDQVDSEYVFLLIGAKEVAANAFFLMERASGGSSFAAAESCAAILKARANVKLMGKWLELLDAHEAELIST